MADIDEIHTLKRIFNDSIYSIVKYGFGKRNLLVIIKNGGLDYLLKIKPYIAKLRKNKNILLVNPDFFVDDGSISKMIQFIDKKKLSHFIVGGKAYSIEKNLALNTVSNNPSFLTLLIEFTSLLKIFKFLGFKNVSRFWNYKRE